MWPQPLRTVCFVVVKACKNVSLLWLLTQKDELALCFMNLLHFQWAFNHLKFKCWFSCSHKSTQSVSLTHINWKMVLKERSLISESSVGVHRQFGGAGAQVEDKGTLYSAWSWQCDFYHRNNLYVLCIYHFKSVALFCLIQIFNIQQATSLFL